MAGINPKQRRFVDEYLIDYNATQAAIRAGYSKKTARAQGGRLLTHVIVQAEIAKRAERHAGKLDITVVSVIHRPDLLLAPPSDWRQPSPLLPLDAHTP